MTAFDFLHMHYADITVAFFVVMFIWAIKE